MIKIIKNVAVSSRIGVSAISMACTYLYLVIAKGISLENLILSFSIFFVTSAGFIWNDIYDYTKDKTAQKNRPICSDKLSIKTAKIAATIISFFSILIPLLFGNIPAVLTISALILGVILYSPFSKNISLFKGLFTAILCCGPIFYANIIAHKLVPFTAYIAIMIFITGREILLDIYDIKGDILSSRKTIPSQIGIKFSNLLSWTLMYIGTTFLIYFAHDNVIIIWLTCFCLLLLIIATLLPQKKESLVVNLTRFVMLISSLSLALI